MKWKNNNYLTELRFFVCINTFPLIVAITQLHILSWFVFVLFPASSALSNTGVDQPALCLLATLTYKKEHN